MSSATSAFDRLLPTEINRAEFSDPTLLLGGPDWSMSLTCEWRWVDPKGAVVSSSTVGADDIVWNLVGDQIVSVEWSGPLALGDDPLFHLRSGGILRVFSDAAFDTWVLHTPSLVLVGPLRDE